MQTAIPARPDKRLFRPWFALFVLGFCATGSIRAADDAYGSLLTAANQLLKDGKLVEARQAATTATSLSPERFEAYFLAGAVAHQQGADAEAKPLIEKALALAPVDRRPKIEQFIATLGSSGTAAAVPPARIEPSNPPPLDAAEKRRLAVLMLIPEEAQQAPTPKKRKQLLNEFMDSSGAFLRDHPDEIQVWIARAGAALELHRAKQGREAAQKILAVPNPDARLQKVLAMLERKKWTEPEVIPPAFEIVDLKLKMAGVPAGMFVMGSESGSEGEDADLPRENEHPQLVVTLTNAYWLGRTEVTQAQWQTIMGTTAKQKYQEALDLMKKAGYDKKTLAYHKLTEGHNYPITYVSHNAAVEFCRRLTEREKSAGRLPTGYHYGLPSEAQWEYACRAGSEGPFWGKLDETDWFSDNSNRVPHEVGMKPENPFGLCDMHGNVKEMTSGIFPFGSDYGAYDTGLEVTNPTGIGNGKAWSLRGGDYSSPSDWCRAAVRTSMWPDGATSASTGRPITDLDPEGIGFRIALIK